MGKTGLSAQLGIAAQVDQTTRATPTRFYEMLSEGLTLDNQRVQSGALRANRNIADRWRQNRKGVAGPITIEHPTVGAGLLWKHILGGEATTTPVGADDARDHTCVIGPLDGDFLTVQKSVPRVSGATAAAFDLIGVKIVSAQLTQNVDGFLQLQLQTDGYDLLKDQSLAVASYPVDLEQFFSEDCIVTVDGESYEADELTLNIDNGLKTDRYKLRGDTRKLEQIEETSVEGRTITGNCGSDYDGNTIFDKFDEGEEFPVELTWTHPDEIEDGFNFSLSIELPRCRADDGTPVVGGPDVVTQPLGFKALKPASGQAITVVVRDNLTTA